MTATDQSVQLGLSNAVGLLWQRVADRFAAADPAYSRLRLASRATLALGMTAAILAVASRVHPLPMVAYGLAPIGAFIGSVAVRDAGWQQQAVTRTFAGVAMTGVALLASMLSPKLLLGDAGFLAVVFVSVYIRYYGQRWTAIGLLGFMAYFMSDYFQPRLEDIGWMSFAAAVGMMMAQLACCVIMPDSAEDDLRRALHTMDQRVNRVLQYLLDAAETGELPRDDNRLMRRQANQLREIVLMAEGFIPEIAGTDGSGSGRGAALATALFDLQMAVERLIRARHDHLPSAGALRNHLGYREGIRGNEPGASGESGFSDLLLSRIRDARQQIETQIGPTPSPLFANAAARAAPSAPPKAAPVSRFAIPEAFHRPIQVTFACGVALAIGHSVSSTRWYWAVVTAFIVFNNTKTRTDTIIRALQRSIGTLGGVVVGALIAFLLRGEATAAMLAIPVLCFLAIYFLQASYGIMIFFLTIALALLYGLLGSFATQLLALRMVETLVGGASGMAAAFFIFPVYTYQEGGTVFRAFLDAFRDVMEGIRRFANGGATVTELVSLSRQLDRRYGDLASTVRPIGGPWAVVTRFGHVREKLLLLLACTHWVRDLCRALEAAGSMKPARATQILSFVDRVEGKIDLAQGAAIRWFQVSRGPDLAGAPLIPPTQPGDSEDLKPTIALAALDLLLTRALLTAGIDPRRPDADGGPSSRG